MRWAYLIKLIVALAAFLLLLLFTIESRQLVSLQLLGWPEPPFKVHLSVVIFVCFAVGLLVGVMMKGGKRGPSGGGSGSKPK